MSIEHYRERKRREAEAAENAERAMRVDSLLTSLATQEGEYASENHPTGDLFAIDGTLYRATQAIVRGERIDGTNANPITLAQVINDMSKE